MYHIFSCLKEGRLQCVGSNDEKWIEHLDKAGSGIICLFPRSSVIETMFYLTFTGAGWHPESTHLPF